MSLCFFYTATYFWGFWIYNLRWRAIQLLQSSIGRAHYANLKWRKNSRKESPLTSETYGQNIRVNQRLSLYCVQKISRTFSSHRKIIVQMISIYSELPRPSSWNFGRFNSEMKINMSSKYTRSFNGGSSRTFTSPLKFYLM